MFEAWDQKVQQVAVQYTTNSPTGPKTYWSTVFINKIKAPSIQPLLVDENMISDF